MPEPPAFRPLKYKCPICGKRGVFGEHHCEAKARAKAETATEGSSIAPIKYILSVAVALLLITAFLWQMIGASSLVLAAIAPIGVLIASLIRKARPALLSGDYRSLLHMANHDKEAVERLIAMEAMRHPGKPRKDLIENLLIEWRRDLR